MRFLVLNGNPKKDGLCHAATEAVIHGAAEGGADIQVITMENMKRCRCCGDGWGVCYREHYCAFGDDGFNEAQAAVKAADVICIVSPVYWWEVSEELKSFLDRLRRCENWLEGHTGALAGKPVLLVVSAGGSGYGLLPCLEQLERFCKHTEAVIFDYIGINRWNKDYTHQSAYAAAKALSQGRKPG